MRSNVRHFLCTRNIENVHVQLVVMLHLLEEDTSLLVLGPAVAGLFIEVGLKYIPCY
jgi:hypothetical protein